MTTTTNHTPATLRAMFDRNPRELDALAAEAVFGVTVEWQFREPLCFTGAWNNMPAVFNYSTDLNAAAILEAWVAERGLDESRASHLSELIDGYTIDWPQHADVPQTDYAALSRNQRASAKDRTIAAILAAQEAK